MNVYVSYVLELKTSKKKFCPSVCLYVRPSSTCVWMDNNIWRSWRTQTNFGEYLLCIKCICGIEIQIEIMILIQLLILSRIYILTKTL